jgi:alanyl-tRNA synthetase
LPASVERLQQDVRRAARDLKHAQEELAGYRAEKYRREAETVGRVRSVLTADSTWDAATVKRLAATIVSEPGFVAVLIGGGAPAAVVMARSADVPIDAGAWMRATTTTLGGRGGGRPELAQGGIPAPAEEILKLARAAITKM